MEYEPEARPLANGWTPPEGTAAPQARPRTFWPAKLIRDEPLRVCEKNRIEGIPNYRISNSSMLLKSGFISICNS